MPYLTPETVPTEGVCRPLFIPNSVQWLAIVSGALTELVKDWNWEQDGAVTVEEAVAAMQAMIDQYYDDACGATCPPIFRLGEEYQWQQYHPDLETWSVPDGDYTIPAVPAREESTEEERLCLAAANAENVLAQVYESLIDSWQLDLSVDFAEAALVSIILGIFGSWLGLIADAAIKLAWSVFVGVYNALGQFFQDAWDAEFSVKMRCLLLSVASEDANHVVTFDYPAFLDGLYTAAGEITIESSLLALQLQYIMLWIGSEGLNHAGATTAITSYTCDCDAWTYVITHENSQGRITFNSAVIRNCAGTAIQSAAPGTEGYVPSGTYEGEPVWQAANVSGVSNVHVAGALAIPSDSVVTDVGVITRCWAGTCNSRYRNLRANASANCADNTSLGNSTYAILTGVSLSGTTIFIDASLALGALNADMGIHGIQISGTGRNPFL